MGVLEWTEASTDENTGVDHLGMRVAQESLYSQLIDFTTTVTWRPRYYSFLCWATQKAFLKNGGRFDRHSSSVDYKGYQKSIKQMEYGLVAATLVNDVHASKVAGIEKVTAALQKLENDGSSELVLQGDHLKASSGGLSIYAGVMRVLGLLSSAEGIDIALPGSKGGDLAEAFERALALTGEKNPLAKNSLSIDELKKIGESCAFNELSSQAQKPETMSGELAMIRKLVFDWDNFQAGKGSAARRILSLGLILESRKLYENETASLALFREFTLLGAANISGLIVPLRLSLIYSSVLVEWRMYQTHAYITFALESMLSLVLVHAEELQDEQGDRVRQSDLVASLLAHIKDMPPEKLNTPGTMKIDGWWNLQLSELIEILEEVVAEERSFPLCEPELMLEVTKLALPRGSADMETWVHDTCLMFLMSLVRMMRIWKEHGPNSWIGTDQGFRLTPEVLINHIQNALKAELSVFEYLQKVTFELVIKQHHQNALRKLLSQPDKDSAKFLIEGPFFVPVGTHSPGTSSPRYENALLFLQDLGYLTPDAKPRVTPDGEAVLEKIRGAA